MVLRGRPQRGRDGGGDGHALIKVWIAPAGGTYPVRVRGQNLATGGYMFLASSAKCSQEAGCDCIDQVCGPDGLCGPALSVAEGDAEPVPLALGARVHSAVDAPYDKDDYDVQLSAGNSYDIETQTYCGGTLDSVLVLLDGDGTQALLGVDWGLSRRSSRARWKGSPFGREPRSWRSPRYRCSTGPWPS